ASSCSWNWTRSLAVTSFEKSPTTLERGDESARVRAGRHEYVPLSPAHRFHWGAVKLGQALLVQHLCRLSAAPAAVAVQQHASGSEPHREIDVVQVGNDSRAVSRLGGEYLQYVQLVLRVEVIRRLVEEINCRTLCQDLCDRDTPPLAAGERRDIPLRKTLEVHELQGSRRNFAILRRFQFERSDVRMTPDQHRLHHGRGKHIV